MSKRSVRQSFRAEIDDLMQIPECRVRIDLKERGKLTLPGRRWITLIVELNAEFTVDASAGTVFLLRLVFDDA